MCSCSVTGSKQQIAKKMADKTSINNYFISVKGYVQNFICYMTIPIRRNSSAREKSALTRTRDTITVLSP